MELVQERAALSIQNHHTDPQSRAPSTKDVSSDEFEDLLNSVLPLMKHDNTFTWDADINGVVVRYIGTSAHQYNFWQDNWFPAPRGVRPHATIYSVQGVPGAEPHAYYCPSKKMSLFINTEYYGQCKSWALGMAAAVLQPKGIHSIHGATGMVADKGLVVVAPSGTGKSTQMNRMLSHPLSKVVGDDWCYVDHNNAKLIADQPERFLYVRTDAAYEEEWMRPLFQRCKLENVVDDQANLPDELHGRKTGFDMGHDHCLWSFGNSRALLPRSWLAGPERVKDEAPLDLLVLLRRDPDEPAEVWLDPEEAVEVLQEGKYQIRPGAGPKEKWGTYDYEPWYNPYLLEPDHQAEARFFKEEVEKSACVLLNTGPKGETIARTQQRMLNALAKATGDERVLPR